MSNTYIPLALRRLVYERAGGCCEYCFVPATIALATHEIDHIIPEKHGGPTLAENLALSCALCNKCKGSDLSSIDPDSDRLVPLYHPRQDRWSEHFRLHDAYFVPLTPIGRVTVRLLQLNRSDRTAERALLIAADLWRVPE